MRKVDITPKEELTTQDWKEVKAGLEDIKLGRTKPIKQVAKELKIKLEAKLHKRKS